MDNIIVFSLTSSKKLTAQICDILGIEEGKIAVNHFADGEILVEPQESVRGRHVFIIQSTCGPVNDHLMEVLICLDAVKRASVQALVKSMSSCLIMVMLDKIEKQEQDSQLHQDW